MKRFLLSFIPILAILFITGCSPSSSQVILYTSWDQIYSEPIIKAFQRTTGIQVKTVYDTESNKTVGLVNRLIAEKNNPQADVFWNSEVGRTIVLKEKGTLDPYHSPLAKNIPDNFKDPQGYWTGFAARARVLVYNTKLIKEAELPKTLNDLLDPKWRGKFVISDPLFGSTATQCAALFTMWGDQKAEDYFKLLKANDVTIVNGNSVVRDKVGSGQYLFGLTDSDDAISGKISGLPIDLTYLDQGDGGMGTLILPNTVCLIKNGPNRKNAEKLINYLLGPQVEIALAKSNSRQIPLHRGTQLAGGITIDSIRAMPVDYKRVGENIEKSSRFLQELFKR